MTSTEVGTQTGGDYGPAAPLLEQAPACEFEICHLLPSPASNGIIDLLVFEGALWAVTGTAHALRWNGSAWDASVSPVRTELVTLWKRSGSLQAMGRDLGDDVSEMLPFAPIMTHTQDAAGVLVELTT